MHDCTVLSGGETTNHLMVFFADSSESSSSCCSSESGEEEGGGEEEGVVEWTPSGAQRALGDWEKHTTVSDCYNRTYSPSSKFFTLALLCLALQGIGSKLLAKMGYVVG